MELQEVTDQVERIPTLEKYSDWSLEDVLKYSDKSEMGQVEVFTPDERVADGNVRVVLGRETNSITFKTRDEHIIDIRKAREEGYRHSVKDRDGKRVEVFSENGIQIEVVDGGDSEREVKAVFKNRNYGYFDLRFLGWGGIFEDHNHPKETSPEYAQQLIKERNLKVGKRQIGVSVETEQEKIRDLVEEAPDGKEQVFHGTSLQDALLISRIGLFAEGGVVEYRPILSVSPEKMSAQLAKDEWSGYPRADLSCYGAIIVFEVDPDEVEVSSDVGERLYHPTHRLEEKERERLQMKAGRNLPFKNPRYLPPDRISQIILVKQTPRK